MTLCCADPGRCTEFRKEKGACMKRYARDVLLFALIWLMAVGPVHAGGLWLTVQPTPDMGVGGAGSQAAGFDASTATANPAAMTRLDRSQVETGIMGLYVDSQFN